MNPAKLREVLEKVRAGEATVDDALVHLKDLPFADLGFATVDHHRALRQGAPEVILGEGKTAEQIAGIASELARTDQNVLVTRLDAHKFAAVAKLTGAPDSPDRVRFEGLSYKPVARIATLEQSKIPALGARPVALVSAGTSDMPVAEECAETMRMLGIAVERVFDVGVAGIHRLLHKRDALDRAAVVVVIAGMEGALASVVGGLVDTPIVAVPTSVGYGAAFGGLAALLGMLTSCASGVTVVNIDNGFGAAYAAARIMRAGRTG